MAVNPMQRRARNSFLIGFLVALIIMALVVVFLLTRIKALNDAIKYVKVSSFVGSISSKFFNMFIASNKKFINFSINW